MTAGKSVQFRSIIALPSIQQEDRVLVDLFLRNCSGWCGEYVAKTLVVSPHGCLTQDDSNLCSHGMYSVSL